mmetsp:Transcript_33728/g.100149  ORF Transcript_33728/g.100149 Transcript_33728/m.100149 type:complete len:398 (+) Transcript_33728:972-2165(+)
MDLRHRLQRHRAGAVRAGRKLELGLQRDDAAVRMPPHRAVWCPGAVRHGRVRLRRLRVPERRGRRDVRGALQGALHRHLQGGQLSCREHRPERPRVGAPAVLADAVQESGCHPARLRLADHRLGVRLRVQWVRRQGVHGPALLRDRAGPLGLRPAAPLRGPHGPLQVRHLLLPERPARRGVQDRVQGALLGRRGHRTMPTGEHRDGRPCGQQLADVHHSGLRGPLSGARRVPPESPQRLGLRRRLQRHGGQVLHRAGRRQLRGRAGAFGLHAGADLPAAGDPRGGPLQVQHHRLHHSAAGRGLPGPLQGALLRPRRLGVLPGGQHERDDEAHDGPARLRLRGPPLDPAGLPQVQHDRRVVLRARLRWQSREALPARRGLHGRAVPERLHGAGGLRGW